MSYSYIAEQLRAEYALRDEAREIYKTLHKSGELTPELKNEAKDNYDRMIDIIDRSREERKK